MLKETQELKEIQDLKETLERRVTEVSRELRDFRVTGHPVRPARTDGLGYPDERERMASWEPLEHLLVITHSII